jgi:glucose/mannose transport system permease protein
VDEPAQRGAAVSGRLVSRWATYAALVVASGFFLLPVYLVVVTALKSPAAINLATTWRLPEVWYWQSFAEAWMAFAPKLANSFVLTVGATIASALMGSMNGYVLSKWRFPGANVVFPLMLFGMFIPYQAILIPLFDFLRSVGLYGNLWGLMLAHVVYGLPITTLIFRNYYAEIPDDMLEAGKIDGAGFFGLYRRIVFPLSLPGFVVVIIWQFTQIWNEFLFAVTLTRTDSQPITVALAQLAGGEAVRWNLPMAGAILAAVPTLIVYIVLGRYFIKGLLAGSVKG